MDFEFHQIKKRPGMFFPYKDDESNLFFGLVCFISGYQTGKGFDTLIVPDDFHQYVGNHYGIRHLSGSGWSTFISENTKSEREALNTFFDLIEQYKNENT